MIQLLTIGLTAIIIVNLYSLYLRALDYLISKNPVLLATMLTSAFIWVMWLLLNNGLIELAIQTFNN